MVLSVALGVDSAVVVQQARIHATSLVACLRVRTLQVRLALELRTAQLGIPRISGLTDARRIVIGDETLGVDAAVAGIRAASVDARFGSGTLAVRHASENYRRWYALDSRIAHVVDRTFADRIVVVDVTERISAARITADARIYALRVYALSVARTFVTGVTLRQRRWYGNSWLERAFQVGISRVLLRTAAHSGVRRRLALRVYTAMRGETSLDAVIVDTLLVIPALVVRSALDILVNCER